MVTLRLMVKTEPKHEITNTANDHGLTAQKKRPSRRFFLHMSKKSCTFALYFRIEEF
jgi:hypothetical protein